MENWRPVREFPEHYEVSNLGRVRRADGCHPSRVGVARKPQRDKAGYVVYMLSKQSRPYLRYAHRLVADAFLGPIPAGMEVNHINGDKSDARLENLEIVTNAQNRAHAYRTLKVAPNKAIETNVNAKLTWGIVDQIRAEHATGGTSHPKLAEKYGVNRMTILRVLNGQSWRDEDRPSNP